MLDHIGIYTTDYERAKKFYNDALAAIGASLVMEFPPEHTGGVNVGGWGRSKDDPCFWVATPAKDKADAPLGSTHIAFSCKDRKQVDAWYEAAIAAGAKDNGKPGLRPQYHPNYYGAFTIDPDGNKIEAVCHLPEA